MRRTSTRRIRRAAVQRTGMPILVAFKSGQFAGYRPVDFAVIFLETLGIVGHPVENYELGHWYVLCRFSAGLLQGHNFRAERRFAEKHLRAESFPAGQRKTLDYEEP